MNKYDQPEWRRVGRRTKWISNLKAIVPSVAAAVIIFAFLIFIGTLIGIALSGI